MKKSGSTQASTSLWKLHQRLPDRNTPTHKQSGSVFVMQLLRGSGARTANTLTKVTTTADIIIFNPSLQAGCYIKVTTIVSNRLRGHAPVCFSPALVVNTDVRPGDGSKPSWLTLICWQQWDQGRKSFNILIKKKICYIPAVTSNMLVAWMVGYENISLVGFLSQLCPVLKVANKTQ